jgi:Xaa-Pro aminopeptidase
MKSKIDKNLIMQKCAKIGDRIFTKVCIELKKHTLKTEIKLADFIKNEIKKSGGTEAFPVIVTSGKNAGNSIHPVPTNSKLSGFVIIDFGIKYAGYCSDMTRTIYVVNPNSKGKTNKPTKLEISLYNTVLNAQNGSILYFKAGIPVSAPDAYVRGFLNQHVHTGYGQAKTLDQYFIHTLGHGISKKVHEKPKIFYKSREVFKAGDMVTSEPGIYIPNKLGIRIEDMYLITNDKPKQITKSSRELLIF